MSSIEEKVIAEIRQRAEKGEAKYGTTMDRDDLSLKEWLQHLKEELMDGVIYTQKIINGLEVLENLEIAQAIIDACDTKSNTLYIEEE
jgi:hypothetical protein